MDKKAFLKSVGRVALSVAVLGFTMASCGNKQEQTQQNAVPSVGVITVTPQTVELETVYPATIKGQRDVEIRPQVTGFITQVCVDEGQQVAKGQTLFVIDQVQYQAAVNQARATVNVAKEALNSAEITARNKQKLYEKNVISEYENQLAQNDLASARATLAQAQATLVNAEKNLSYTVVKAPSAGYVGTIPNREGSLASPSSASPLTTVSDISNVYAYISFNERQVLEMTQSGKVSLQQALDSLPAVKLRLSDGTDYSVTGKMSTISGMLSDNTGSATVRVLFTNQNGMLRSGSTGSIVIPVHAENVYLVPQNATSEIQDARFAYVVGKDNKVEARQIKVLAQNDGKNFVVTSGLNKGDRVVVEGVGVSVREGMTINPVAPKAAAAQEQK